MANTSGKVHPSAAQLNKGDKLPVSQGNPADMDRSHITSGPQTNPAPAKNRK